MAGEITFGRFLPASSTSFPTQENSQNGASGGESSFSGFNLNNSDTGESLSGFQYQGPGIQMSAISYDSGEDKGGLGNMMNGLGDMFKNFGGNLPPFMQQAMGLGSGSDKSALESGDQDADQNGKPESPSLRPGNQTEEKPGLTDGQKTPAGKGKTTPSGDVKLNFDPSKLKPGQTKNMEIAADAAQKNGIPKNLFLNQMHQEAGFKNNLTSRTGAKGPAQIMPGTAKGWGVKDRNNPNEAYNAAAKAMRGYYDGYKGSGESADQAWRHSLAAYNAGPGRAHRYQQIPETRQYVSNILGAGFNS